MGVERDRERERKKEEARGEKERKRRREEEKWMGAAGFPAAAPSLNANNRNPPLADHVSGAPMTLVNDMYIRGALDTPHVR